MQQESRILLLPPHHPKEIYIAVYLWVLLQDLLEKGVATHSSTLAQRNSWTEEPGRLQSMRSQRVGQDWSNLACTGTMAPHPGGEQQLHTETPDRLEPESSGLRFLEHCPVTSPPINQEKVTHPTASFPNFTYKNSSLKITGEFRSVNRSQATPSPYVVLSLLQTLMFGFIWPPCASGIWCTCIWRRQWHPTPVLLPGKSHGCRSLVGCSPSWIWLRDFTFPFHLHALEKEMATHSSVPAWRIPGTGKPGGLPSMGSHRVGHDWSDLAVAAEDFKTPCTSPDRSSR